MATVAITPQYVTDEGADITFTAIDATDTYTLDNDNRTVLYVKNTGGSGATITLDIPKNVLGLAVTDPTVTVPATTGERFIGPFPPNLYGATMTFTNDQATGVTVAAIRI